MGGIKAAQRLSLREDAAWRRVEVRSSKYLNNIGEQDYRGVELGINSMLGVKVFEKAAITIAGIELMQRIRKGQFDLRKLTHQRAKRPGIRAAVLSA